MGSFRCPNCQATVNADSPVGLVCPRCGYGGPGGPVPDAAGAAAAQPVYQATQPLPTAGMMHGHGPMCPRCRSTYTQKGGIPTWAVVCAIAGFFLVCFFSLLFLIAKDDNTCFNCGMKWKG
jgi:RNA polymerase subunit RPABC4/transcription elongation factor Spt4